MPQENQQLKLIELCLSMLLKGVIFEAGAGTFVCCGQNMNLIK
jgi:hypothetical protein